jgi:tRNA(adenine34) deaminase
MVTTDEKYMWEALKQARVAFEQNEIPVGAVVVCSNTIVARSCNQTQLLHDVTAHAEMLSITAAANYLGGKYLNSCTLYVTLEPCVMCAGALFWAQLGRIVYGASDPKRGYSHIASPLLHPKTQVVKGVLEAECRSLLEEFFQKLRN